VVTFPLTFATIESRTPALPGVSLGRCLEKLTLLTCLGECSLLSRFLEVFWVVKEGVGLCAWTSTWRGASWLSASWRSASFCCFSSPARVSRTELAQVTVRVTLGDSPLPLFSVLRFPTQVLVAVVAVVL